MFFMVKLCIIREIRGRKIPGKKSVIICGACICVIRVPFKLYFRSTKSLNLNRFRSFIEQLFTGF